MPRAKPSQSVSTAPPELLPDQVIVGRPTLEARLSGLNRAQLQALVQTLAARQPIGAPRLGRRAGGSA
jgi:hypothetical protein